MSINKDFKHNQVPEWYQRRFMLAGQGKYWYLDLKPKQVVRDGSKFTRRYLLNWGPGSCFAEDNLYTTRWMPRKMSISKDFSSAASKTDFSPDFRQGFGEPGRRGRRCRPLRGRALSCSGAKRRFRRTATCRPGRGARRRNGHFSVVEPSRVGCARLDKPARPDRRRSAPAHRGPGAAKAEPPEEGRDSGLHPPYIGSCSPRQCSSPTKMNVVPITIGALARRRMTRATACTVKCGASR